MVKFKTIRLQDVRELDAAMNDLKLGAIIDYQLTMPDYRAVIVLIRYEDDPAKDEAKDDKATS